MTIALLGRLKRLNDECDEAIAPGDERQEARGQASTLFSPSKRARGTSNCTTVEMRCLLPMTRYRPGCAGGHFPLHAGVAGGQEPPPSLKRIA